MSRTESVEKGARKGGYLEVDESIQMMVVVNGGKFVVHGFDSYYTKRFALAATERNFYVFSLGQVGFKSVKGVAYKMPIEEAEVTKTGMGGIKVNHRGNPGIDEAEFQTALAVRPGPMVEYMQTRGGQ